MKVYVVLHVQSVAVWVVGVFTDEDEAERVAAIGINYCIRESTLN